MHLTPRAALSVLTVLAAHAAPALADDDDNCRRNARPTISFVEFQSPNLIINSSGQVVPNGLLTVKGKLQIPADCRRAHERNSPRPGLPAVLILHGSSGVDARGDFHAESLHAAGIATLEIDMWEARGVSNGASRPALPALTYPDAFSALRFLGTQAGIDAQRVGVLGFSWGGVIAMASASNNVASAVGGTLRFKAHVAHYPVCYAYNNPNIPYSAFGATAGNPLTGAPVLIQIGTQDDYDRATTADNGAQRCINLKASLTAAEQRNIDVVTYDGAYHAWDKLQVSFKPYDPFGHLGADRFNAAARIDIRPDVAKAHEARQRLVRFFERKL